MKTRKNNLNRNALLVICFFAFAKIFAQQTETAKVENCIKEKVTAFFTEKDKLNGKEVSANAVHILEIVEKKVLGYNKVGIYFCSKAPSRQKYFLLKNENKFKILASNDSLEVMQEVITFLKENKFPESKAVEYLNESAKIFSENMNKPTEKTIAEQKWITCN